ncbi:MAG: glutathione S-transferase N-terminal domain-containing protein [Alphaproteobacteria bacterium]|nr:glutathione S-transferase N-terminal domain-containing protein [Alphaproteobacteria bacterium]MBF0374094.1 glutathione S-transferase N-terminal domain-containing protein [Alphaproteobacteria bacterium]
MKLLHSTTSPYARKALVVAMETGLERRLELVASAPFAPGSDVPETNPLGRIPALITEGGEVLYDSPVICEYLDSLHDGAKLFPHSGGARWTALRRQALGDGILDAAVLNRIETAVRPEDKRWAGWIARQDAATRRGLDALEEEADSLGESFGIGQVTIACALGYLDFRFPRPDWREGRPRLAAWYAGVETRPSLAATTPRE